MAGMKISDLDFVRLLPAFMRDDEAAIALSKAMNTLIQPPGSRIPTIRTWDEIDNLNEPECDELAWELDIDWYDSTGMSLEEKRETICLLRRGLCHGVVRNVRLPLHIRGTDNEHQHGRAEL